ncbi:MAG TPA: dephospho-CoA kinase [Rhodospirillaceae bacterium]|nr:dephospho-CoA kinase [Rhodospirillaceae bacterium]
MKQKKPLLIGLTGSIGMGKSTAAKRFAALGLPVFCADDVVHILLAEEGSAKTKIMKLFPQAIQAGQISRKKLGKLVFEDSEKREKLEKVLHPLVRKAEKTFWEKAKKDKVRAVLFDIPLLFETGVDKKCDITLCVSASAEIQKERVLRRKNMTEDRFHAILKQQMPDAEKKRRATFIITSDDERGDMYRQIKILWAKIEKEFLNA